MRLRPVLAASLLLSALPATTSTASPFTWAFEARVTRSDRFDTLPGATVYGSIVFESSTLDGASADPNWGIYEGAVVGFRADFPAFALEAIEPGYVSVGIGAASNYNVVVAARDSSSPSPFAVTDVAFFLIDLDGNVFTTDALRTAPPPVAALEPYLDPSYMDPSNVLFLSAGGEFTWAELTLLVPEPGGATLLVSSACLLFAGRHLRLTRSTRGKGGANASQIASGCMLRPFE